MSREGAARPVLGIIGGTGVLGAGLARRWVNAGYPVVIGSRDPAKAGEAASGLEAAFSGAKAEGAGYAEAAAAAGIVVLTVPYQHQPEVIEAMRPGLRGQLLLDTTVPLMPGDAAIVQLPPAGSAAVALQQRLGNTARVVSAFHTIPAKSLREENGFACDVLVFGDAIEDRDSGIRLVDDAGMHGIHGGPLANSAAAEAMTSVLISINRAYAIRNACLTITGLDPDQS
jgi:NADPH-dependent F420 reductase